MLTKEQILALPKKKANRAEVDAYYYLDAFHTELAQIKADTEKRCRLVPGLWRDLCLVESKLGGILLLMGGTFETEKARQIKRMGQNLHVELKFNKQAVRDQDMMLVDMEEMGVLITFASQHCKLQMCEPHECRNCRLGKVLDGLSWLTRENRAWWEVLAALVREGESEHAGEQGA